MKNLSLFALFLSAFAVISLAGASSASAQGVTQIASTPPEHAWWPTPREHARSAPVALRARDEQKLASWYVEHLGFLSAGVEGPVRGGGARARETTIYHDAVVLQVEQAKASKPQRIVLAVHDLEAQLRALEKAGVPLVSQDARSAQLRDPEGNLIELVDDGSTPHQLANAR